LRHLMGGFGGLLGTKLSRAQPRAILRERGMRREERAMRKRCGSGRYRRKNLWTLSHDPAVDRGLRNAYFARRGLVSLLELQRTKPVALVAPIQLTLEWG